MITQKAINKALKKRQQKLASALIPLEPEPDFPEQQAFITDTSKDVAAQCSRRAGKCRPGDTLVKTPQGSRFIKDLKAGDEVYGYNSDGSISIAKVLKLYDQGMQEIVDIVYNRRIIASSTRNHRWLAHNSFRSKRQVKELQNFNSRDKISVGYYPIPGGDLHINEAYTLGALLGDGCSLDNGLHISGTDNEIFDEISKELQLPWKKIHKNNRTHSIIGAKKLNIPYYESWCHRKKAHEKIAIIDEIRKWNRNSQLRFLAGLIDTDGSIEIRSDGRLCIRISMQAKSIIDTIKLLLLDLFQVQARIGIDNRSKYKNGPVHTLSVTCNVYSKRILKELPTKCPRKQYKPEYEALNNKNCKEEYIGFTTQNPRLEQCYDIEIDNDTHLFLDANGLIGHNTNGLALRFKRTMDKYPKSQCVYLALTRESAKDIMWPVLQELNDKYGWNCEFIPSQLSMKAPNGATLRLYGADMKHFVKRLKGRKYPGVGVDEAQDFGTHLQSLLDDVLKPATADYEDGWVALTGTPGPVPNGYFFEVTQEKKYGYSLHQWTLYENPYMPGPQEFVAELMKKRSWDENNPTLLREYRNKWVLDVQSLWIQYKESVNHYVELPTKKWHYILGIDLGFKDADALGLICYSDDSKETYLVKEVITQKQGLTELVDQIKELQKAYNIDKMVIDEGGLGKKLAEEMRRRHHIPVQAAEKSRKQETVGFFNDALRTGIFKAKSGSKFVKDSYLVQIDWDKSTPDKIVVKKKPHSDIIDAVLYAFKESPAFTYLAPISKPKKGTDEYSKRIQQEMFENAQRHFEEQADLERMNDELGLKE